MLQLQEEAPMPKEWRPISNVIIGFLLGMSLSLIINTISGWEKTTLFYVLTIIALLSGFICGIYYHWKLTKTEEQILYYKSTSQDDSIKDLYDHENDAYSSIRGKMRLAGRSALVLTLVGVCLLMSTKYELSKEKDKLEKKHQEKEDLHMETITRELSGLKEQVKQLPEVLDNRIRLMLKPSPSTPGNQGGPKKPAAIRGRRG